ncbi:MAG: SusC/RagA family TonB-linked outer membrane protein, partial [Firmicutes bacterium]|nr:SusC/RagA family TonB-linked outer membrane protein [Bacillota bacterium]
KGTTTGTVTDQDGNFSLTNISTGATLVFSFVGMKTQELEVAEQSTFNIILEEDAIGIEEVVAIGYGTKKKSHLTGSVESVNTGVLENRPVKSVTEALQGVVPGLNVDLTDGAPESDPNLNIRGFTGFDKDNKPEQKGPLVLVDGIELTLSDINPNDVESISVLKDAAASAIYGSRAPYGVILIKTKSGKRNEKIKVNYNGNLRFGSPINLPSWVDSWVAAEKFNEGRRNMLQGPVYGDEVIQRMKDYGAGLIEDNNISRPDGSWGAHFDAHANTDWFAKTMRSTVPSQQHNFSFSGGSNNTSYYMGLGYNESVGIFKGIGDYKDRYNALLKVNTDATEWLNLSLGMNYIKTDEQGPNGGTGRDYNTFFNGMSRSWPNWPDINPNGSPHWLSSVPLLQGKLGSEGKIRNISTVTGGLLITPIKNWEINGQYTWKHADENYERITLPLTVIRANGTTRPSGRAPNYSEVRREFFASNYHTLDINTSYTKSINNHNFLVMAGYQEEYFRSEKVIASNRDLY